MSRFLFTALLLGVSVDVQVYFSPDGGCEQAVIRAINTADSTIDVAVYYFTEGDIARALVRAHERGVVIRVLIDNESIHSQYSKARFLHNNGVAVRDDDRAALMHHKFAVVDDSVVLTGSYNWTAAAENTNNENLLVITSKSLATLYKAEFLKLWQVGADFSPPESTETSSSTPLLAPALTPAPAPAVVEGDYIVYVTKTGSKYHRESCHYLKYSKRPMLKSEAIRLGYGPCSVCRP